MFRPEAPEGTWQGFLVMVQPRKTGPFTGLSAEGGLRPGRLRLVLTHIFVP
jgi:hypothetical protein